MLSKEQVLRETVAYRLKLIALDDRFQAGERHSLYREVQDCADALTCLLEEAPLSSRDRVDYLLDRYETLRISCTV